MREPAEDELGGDRVGVVLDVAGVGVGHEAQGHGAHAELRGERDLRAERHVHEVGARVPQHGCLGPRREPRTLDHRDRRPRRDLRHGLDRDAPQLGAERLGERQVPHERTVVEGVGATPRPVDELVGNRPRLRRELGAQGADGGRRDDRARPEFGECPDVGARVDAIAR